MTNVLFSGLSSFPQEFGQSTIRGANNKRAVVQATGGTLRISIDVNRDGGFADPEDRVVNGL
jgi:hypothetical protein